MNAINAINKDAGVKCCVIRRIVGSIAKTWSTSAAKSKNECWSRTIGMIEIESNIGSAIDLRCVDIHMEDVGCAVDERSGYRTIRQGWYANVKSGWIHNKC